MKRRIALFAVLFLFVLLCGCDDNYDNSAYYSAMTANRDVSLSEPMMPMNIGGIIVDTTRGKNTLNDFITYSDLIVVGRVKSIYSAQQDPLLYYSEMYLGLPEYLNCFVTCYEIVLSEVLKGGHSENEKIILTYPGNIETLKWTYRYGEPDALMNVGSDYLLFLNCRENNVTDEQHSCMSKKYSVFSISEDDLKCIETANPYKNPLDGMTLSSVRERVDDLLSHSEPKPTRGMEIESHYSDPQNYMCELTDNGCFASEFQLVNTADDIIAGTITDIEDFIGEVCYYSAEKTQCEGQVLTVRIRDSLKGDHGSGDEIKIFVRSDENRDAYLSPYEKGLDCVFFLACMDSVSPFHLSIGEFQAALLSNNGTIYNRANFTDEALTTGFIIIQPYYYMILFSECFTYEQLADTIKGYMVELPGRITYGEFCLTQNE